MLVTTQALLVNEKTLEARLRRALKKDSLFLKKISHNSRWYRTYGPYSVVDLSTNGITTQGVDLECLAREWEVLKGYEKIVYEDEAA